jgi:DNA invertase Pin-like site-specific DNA recombinase
LQKSVAKVHSFARTFATVRERGYEHRVYTGFDPGPNLDLQMQALRKAGYKKTFREKLSGARRERPEFQRMLDQLRNGMRSLFEKLDRLARSIRDLLETWKTIREAGARFQSLSETLGQHY